MIFDHLGSRARQLWVQLAIGGLLIAHPGHGFAQEPEEIARLEKQVIKLRDQSKWVEAMPLAERLVTVTITKYGEVHTNTADALHHWAYLSQMNGDYDKAEPLWLRALAIDEKLFGKDTVETTRRLHLLSSLYISQHDYQKARPLLQQALAIREKYLGPNHVETAQVLRSMARLDLRCGDFAQGEATLLRAMSIYEKGGPTSRAPLAATLSALGGLYVSVGDYDKALAMIARSLETRRIVNGLEHVSTASSFRELASIHKHQGKFDKAESLLRESLRILERLLGTNHVMVSEVLDDFGRLLLTKRDLANAETALQRARTIVEQNFGKDHPQVARVLNGLSQLHEIRGDYEQARQLCKQAYDIRERHLGALDYSTIRSLRQVAILDTALGRSDDVLAVAERLQQGEERLLANMLSFTSERQRLASQRNSFFFRHSYNLWATLGAAKPLARTILRTKGLVLDSLLEDRLLAEAADDKGVRDLIGQITKARRRLTELMPAFAQNIERTNQNTELYTVSGQIESLEASLARRVSGVGRARRALSVQAEEVRSAIPEGAVLLEMLRYGHYLGKGEWRESYGVLVLAHGGESRWVRFGPADDLIKAIRIYQHAVRRSEAPQALIQSLHDLYDQLWVPLVQSLPTGTKQVIVSPDGELNFVSFATLLTPSNRFLGEQYLFSYVSCGRDLVAQNKPVSEDSTLLVWANPDFGAPAPKLTAGIPGLCNRELRGLDFRPLPGAEKEGRLLCSRARQLGFREAVLHLGSEATEAKLHEVHSPKALHLATHGFVLPQMETQHVTEDDYGKSEVENFAFPKFNPMVRSGLALAGGQHSLQAWTEGKTISANDDGIITANEIGGLNLRGTWLVVLSACDTGTGEARAGEGVLGLRRGFVQAGAQNLLLTLWPIEDGATAQLMVDFYAQAQKTGSPSHALAQVQRACLQELRAEKGIAQACRIAGPFILSFQGKPESAPFDTWRKP